MIEGICLKLLVDKCAGNSSKSKPTFKQCYPPVMKLVDIRDLKSRGLTAVRVQVPPGGPPLSLPLIIATSEHFSSFSGQKETFVRKF